MTPLKQRNRHEPEKGIYGDCHRAALASVLEMSLDDVPHFCDPTHFPKDWVKHERDWLRDHGFTPITAMFQGDLETVLYTIAHLNPDTYCILGGTSRNGCGHSVIAYNGEIVHDPSLDDSGIVGPMKDGYYWVTFFGHARAICA